MPDVVIGYSNTIGIVYAIMQQRKILIRENNYPANVYLIKVDNGNTREQRVKTTQNGL